MPRLSNLAAVATTAALVAGGVSSAAERPDAPTRHAGRAGAYTVGLFGDVPYGPEGRAELPALVADMNAEKLAFSIHVGDIKSGSERCDDSLYTTARDTFESYRRPVVYTPGDNEWTDCHRAGNGGYDPLERLAKLREVLFADPGRSLGRRELRLRPQSADLPENVRWNRGPVTFATVHVVGSNNNRAAAGDGGRTPEQVAAANAEYEARNRANLAWIRSTFTQAQRRGSRGVVLAMQADLDFEGRFAPGSTTGFADTLAALRRETIDFDGQVALLHGDSHVFVHDRPLRDSGGLLLENFTRVETFGAADTHWVALRIDPRRRNLFAVEPRVVAANAEEHTG